MSHIYVFFNLRICYINLRRFKSLFFLRETFLHQAKTTIVLLHSFPALNVEGTSISISEAEVEGTSVSEAEIEGTSVSVAEVEGTSISEVEVEGTSVSISEAELFT